MTYGHAIPGAAAAPKRDDGLANEFDKIGQRLVVCVERAGFIADYLYGPHPQAVDEAGPVPAPNSLAARAELQQRVLTRLEATLDRIQSNL